MRRQALKRDEDERTLHRPRVGPRWLRLFFSGFHYFQDFCTIKDTPEGTHQKVRKFKISMPEREREKWRSCNRSNFDNSNN